MKKLIKSRIFLIIICGIVFTGLGVYASNIYNSTDVLYTSSDGTSMTVSDALNELYNKKNDSSVSVVYEFMYIGKEQIFTIPYDGRYRFDVWGAQGGVSTSSKTGGYGAYATGEITLKKDDILYINVGGAGSGDGTHKVFNGGYNGGGNAQINSDGHFRTASDGGATSIAAESGLLSTLSEKLSSIYIVAAGGGGGGSNSVIMACSGGNGGGILGVNSSSYIEGTITLYGIGASQTSGGTFYDSRGNTDALYHAVGSFGQGASCFGTGGGGGLYGGGCSNYGAGGGSSYIGNSLLKNKKIYCYNCEESSEENTKTISNTNVSDKAITEYSNIGNGYARITYLGN